MAIGILMALRKVGEAEAFDLMRRVSSHRDVKLRLVAEDVIRTGRLHWQTGVAPVPPGPPDTEAQSPPGATPAGLAVRSPSTSRPRR